MQAVSDILEGIYRWADWPARTPVLPTSLHDSGKSRADLWALAAMTAVEFGFATNNAACGGDQNLTLQFRCIRPAGGVASQLACWLQFGEPMQPAGRGAGLRGPTRARLHLPCRPAGLRAGARRPGQAVLARQARGPPQPAR